MSTFDVVFVPKDITVKVTVYVCAAAPVFSNGFIHLTLSEWEQLALNADECYKLRVLKRPESEAT